MESETQSTDQAETDLEGLLRKFLSVAERCFEGVERLTERVDHLEVRLDHVAAAHVGLDAVVKLHGVALEAVRRLHPLPAGEKTLN